MHTLLAAAPILCAVVATLQVATSTLGDVSDLDELGNRTFKSDSSSTVSTYDAKNRLDAAWIYGPERYPSLTLTWDVAGRLASSSDGASYRYDAMGRRVQKTAAGQTTVYHHDPSGRVIAETDLAGQKQRIFIYLGSKLVTVDGCAAGATAACGERQWYHTDSLGSVVARTDSTGAVVARLDYQPWGEQWSVAGQGGDRQYNGRVYDPGTGFHDYGARMYWPQIGRFISADSVMGSPGNPMTLNRYSYVLNNPNKFTDPSGHNPLLVGALIALLFIENDQNANLAPAAAAVAPAAATAVGIAAGVKSGADGNWDQASLYFAGAALSGAVAKGAAGESAALNNGARSAANGVRLGKQLASEAQSAELMCGGGEPIAGAGTNVTLRSAGRLAAEHGGTPADWAKVRSSNYKAKDGASFETHGYRNTQSGEVKELKTKFQ
jgi:RHS repeat-associated protein